MRPTEPAQTARDEDAEAKLAAAAESGFALGDFVMLVDLRKRGVFGDQPGVIVGKSGTKSKCKTTYTVRVLQKTLQCAGRTLQRVEVQQSAFPLAELPAPVLALVLYWLPLGHAARQAVVSRKFAAAFRDNVSWKRRCMRDVTGIDVEATLLAEKENSWMAFYRRHAAYRICIVTVFENRGGRSVTEEFTIECCPRMSVETFLDMVAIHPLNRQALCTTLQPHDPSKLGRHDAQWEVISAHPGAKPNCSFRQDNGQATIAKAGLCDGAILEQPECMRWD